MKIAVLSGKGGTGKTYVAVNLAAAAGRCTYIDCDVEEPNGRLFLKPENVRTVEIETFIPSFDTAKCTGCRKCVDFCRFNALVYIRSVPKVFSEVCHACGGCEIVCPEGAISEIGRPIGHLELGRCGGINAVTGVLNPGEASGVGVIRAALQHSSALTIIDCPPGSACNVMECVSEADFCILVAEPTAFGFHNFRMVHELASLLNKPCGLVVNKEDHPYEPLETYCRDNDLPVLAKIPYDSDTARLIAQGEIVIRKDAHTANLFRQILNRIGGAS